MKLLKNTLAALAIGTTLFLTQGSAMAQGQGRGNFDPEQFRQRMMERYREDLGVKNDDEWKLMEPRIQKVMEARRDMGGAGMFGRGPGGPGGRRGNGGDQANAGNGGNGGNQDRPRRFGPEPSADEQALQKAVEAGAPSDEIKAKLAKVREERKAKEAKLEQAQDDLKKLLSVKQEAAAVLAGLLK